MDLGAYTQINELEKIAKDNGIDVPRLRGYRLMKNEQQITDEELNHMIHTDIIDIVKGLCRSFPLFWDPNSSISRYDYNTNRKIRYYLNKKYDEDGHCIDIVVRWDRIHGRKRKILKFEIKKIKRNYQKQYQVFNKYVGRDDVIYIHSRIGGNNWKFYNGDNTVAKQPWFLEKVDDAYDSTYCDIYAKIKTTGDDIDDFK